MLTGMGFELKMYTKCILNVYYVARENRYGRAGIEKAPPEWGSYFALHEQVPDAERRLPVDLVVGGFPGVPYPPHALPPVSGDEGLSRLPLPLARGSRLE